MSNASDPIQQELSRDGILRLTMNDKKRRNALSEQMMAGLSESINQASTNNAVRVIVIAANGPAFCSGHDLKQMSAERNNADNGHQYFSEVFSMCSALMQLITNNPKPVIAEVSGVAAAAGCQLVACCDLAIASESARFVTPRGKYWSFLLNSYGRSIKKCVKQGGNGDASNRGNGRFRKSRTYRPSKSSC